jgi:hydrogenase expression/formation protein HypE
VRPGFAAIFRRRGAAMSDGRERPRLDGLSCPIPISEYPNVQLAHGGGGRMSQMLIDRLFVPAFGAPDEGALHDGALVDLPPGRLAISTDSFVISPLFFPGGDIGSLAVHGTVNDVAMCGARPSALSVGFVIEEGLPMDDLWRIVTSMARAADDAGVRIVTGDTKVVDRGKGDGLYVNTTGIGIVPQGVSISPRRARHGDAVVISGSVGVHGIAIMSVREGLRFETQLESDSADLSGMVASLLSALGSRVHVLRDPTRGGVASALNEIASSAGAGIRIDERSIPVDEQVRAACEILGFDPLYVANEGKLIAIVERSAAEEAVDVLRRHPLGGQATIIGEVVEAPAGRVLLRSRIGGERFVDMLSGEQLPRIC